MTLQQHELPYHIEVAAAVYSHNYKLKEHEIPFVL
jgi:hypothetical protein